MIYIGINFAKKGAWNIGVSSYEQKEYFEHNLDIMYDIEDECKKILCGNAT